MTRNTILNLALGACLVALLGLGSAFAQCSYSVQFGQVLTYTVNTSAFNVTATPGCAWTAVSNNWWIKIIAGSGTGDGVVQYKALANIISANRFGTITIMDKTFNIIQSAAPTSRVGIYSPGVAFWFLDANANRVYNGPPNDRFNSFGPSSATAQPVLGDWNGDGTTDIGMFDKGMWYIDKNGNGVLDPGEGPIGWGGTNSVPVVGDWNGDGKTKIGVFDAGFWTLDLNGNYSWDSPAESPFQWGAAGWTPVVGDWDGTGTAKVGVHKEGVWVLDKNGNRLWDQPAEAPIYWGTNVSTPLVGDWNGDGKTKVGMFDTGYWVLDLNGNYVFEPATEVRGWGARSAVPTPGDWNGDGIIDLGVWETGYYTLDINGNNTWDGQSYGWGTPPNDKPIVGRFVPVQ